MQTHFSHIVFLIDPANLPFYKDLLDFLGWQTLHASGWQTLHASEEAGMLGVGGQHGESLWFIGQAKEVSNDYDGPGMNHLAIGTATQADVDTAASYLTERGVNLLFETPQHRPEFSQGDGQTYYQVMFESPDHILWEVVYIGPKAA